MVLNYLAMFHSPGGAFCPVPFSSIFGTFYNSFLFQFPQHFFLLEPAPDDSQHRYVLSWGITF